MRTFHSRVVRWARKPRTCTWCGDPVQIGQPYQSYQWAERRDAGTVVLHPECGDAMARLTATDPHFVGWCPGDFLRGSTKVR